MRRLIFVLASIIAVFTFSCDTTSPDFDDAVPGVFNLTTKVQPSDGGSIEPSGGEYVAGAPVEIRAIPETGYMFDRWEGDLVGSANPGTLILNRNRSVTAFFVEAEYPLNIEIIGEGTVREEVISQTFEETQSTESVSATTSESDTLDDQQIQTGADDSNIDFDIQGRDQLRPNLQTDIEIRETNQLRQQSVANQESATASQDVESFTILLTAEPDEGWRFDRWEGDLVGTQNPDTVVVDDQKNVTAVFTQEDAPTIEIVQNPSRTTAGEAISPAPIIQITDHNDDPVSSMDVEARLNINDFTTASTTIETTDVNGIASFENLVIEASSGSYSISFVADDSDISSISSPEFEVRAAAAVASESEADVPNGVAGSETEITITVRDRFGNRVNGVAGDLSVSVSGDNSATPSVSTGDNSGEYIASYTPVSAGEDEIAIELNSAPIAGSPYTSAVTTSDISRSESSVTAEPTELQAGSSSTVTVNLRDANGNAIGGLSDSDFDINISGSGSAGSVSETSTGTYEFSVTNSAAQQVTVTVTAAGVTLDETPEITFTGADSDLIVIPSGSQPGTSIAGQVIANSPSVRISDEFGNNIPGMDVTVTEQNGQEFASGTGTVTTNNSGLAVFDDLIINEAGRYNLVFSSGSLTVTSNAFNVNPADADASETTAEVPNGAAGDQTNITITVRDEFGNRVEGVSGDLSVSVSGANSGASVESISNEGNGVYTTGYTPILIGTDEITIELEGSAIQGSPFSSNVITSNADDVSIEQQPGETVAGQSVSGPPSVLVTDALGNPVDNVEVVASLQGSASFDGGTTTVNTSRNGIAEFNNLVIESAGSYTMVFNAIGVSENAVSNSFNIVAASADNLSRVSGNNQSGTVTSTLSDPFVVRITDEFGNAVSGFSVGFEIDDTPSGASGHQLSSTSVSTDSDGRASSTLTLGDATGTYTVLVSAGAAGNTTFSASATAGSAESFNFNTISSPQTAGQSFSISLTAVDSQGNTATGYQGTASLSAASGSISPSSASFSSGTASLNVELNTAGTNQSITATDGSISGTSNTFTVESGGADSGNSSVSASPTSLEVGNSSTVTIELRDGSNNPVSGLSNSDFNISVSGSGSAGSVSESGSTGNYTVSISNTTAEQVTVNVNADGVNVGSVSITFTAGDAHNVTIESGNNQTGNVNEQLSSDFVVRVTDEFGNLVSGASVSFSVTDTPGGSDGTLDDSSDQTGGNGLASTSYTLGDTSGEYTITASVSGAGSVDFTATAETGSASQMNITTQPGNTTAGDAISPTPQVEVLDDANNPVEGVDVSVNLQGGNFDSGTATRSTNSSGVAGFPGLVIETAGSYSLVFDADAAGVSNQTSNSFEVGAANADAVDIVSGDNQTANVNEELTDDFVVVVTDQFGNLIENETVNFEIIEVPGGATGQSLSSESDLTNSSGQAVTLLTLGDEAGTYRVEASVNGAGSVTFSAEAQAGEASIINITSQPENTQAGQSIRGSPAVKVTDSNGNGISGVNVLVSEEGGYTFDGGDVSRSTNSTGDASFNDLVINETGSYRLIFETNGVDPITSDEFNVSSAAPSSSNSSVSATSPHNADGVDASTVTMQIEDSFGNLITGLSDDDFNIDVGSATAGAISETGTNGTYEFSVTHTTAETVTVTVTADGVELDDSPSIEFVATVPSQMTLLEQPSQTTAGTTIEPSPAVELLDAAGDAVSGVNITASLNGASFSSASDNETSTNATGIAAFNNLAIETAGENYTITFNADEPDVVDVNSEPFNIIAAAGDPSNSSANVPDGTVGESTNITINIEDEFGNAVSNAAGDLVVTVSSDNTATPNVTETGAPGVYAASYTPENAGADDVTITLGGDAISGSPYTSNVSAGSAESFRINEISSPQTAEQSFSISLTAVDSQGNTATGYQGTASLSAASGSISPSSASFSSGTASLNVELNTAGSNQSITAEDGSISGTSNTFTVETGGVDAGNSSVSASPTSLEVGNNSTATIELRDGRDNPVSGLANDIFVDVSGSGIAGSVNESGSSGDYSVSISNETAETVTVTVTADGVELDDTPTIEFVPSQPSVMQITDQPEDTRAGEQIRPIPRVRITDNAGKPFENIDVTVSEADGQSFYEGTLTQSTNSNGEASFDDLIITSAGRYSLVFNADADGVPNATSEPFNVNPGVGNPNNTTAEVLDGIIDNESTIIITVRDDYNNLVGGAASELFVEISMNNSATPTVIETVTLGEYTASYTPATTGEDTIEITLNDVQISGNLYSSQVTESD